MVAGFNRSFSLPGSPRLRARPVPAKSCHVRSVSLPCRSHPLISQIKVEIQSVKEWQSSQPGSHSASWICDGLARLELVHTSLGNLLQLPQNHDTLRRRSGFEWTDRVLDDFLRLADAHGCFRSEITVLSEHQSEAQIAIRRNDEVMLGSSIRSMRKTEKQLVKLAACLGDISKSSSITTRFVNGIEEAELAGIIREVINVTVSASAEIFLGTASLSSTTSTAVAGLLTVKNSWMSLRRLSPSPSKSLKNVEGEDWGRNVMERLGELEEYIGAVENRSERLFRCFVNTRVSLLNTITH